MKRLMMHGKTNDGDIVKQYCFIAEDKSKGYEKSLIVHRLILTDKVKDYFLTGHLYLRSFKGKSLFSKHFSMKISSLKVMMKFALEN
jgi:hypothetical protein